MAKIANISGRRVREIERITEAMKVPLKHFAIRHAANLSYLEVYASMIRTIEGFAKQPTGEILKEADVLTAKYGGIPLSHD